MLFSSLDIDKDKELVANAIELRMKQNLNKLLKSLSYLQIILYFVAFIGLFLRDKEQSIHFRFTLILMIAMITTLS